jgi:hypothetical protein
MRHSDSIAKIAPALVAAQGAIKPIPKDGKNPAFRSRYATLDGIMEAVRPVLAANQLALVQGTTLPETDEGGKLYAVSVETRLLHASGEWLATTTRVPVGKSDAHGLGSAITYGRRYGVQSLLALTADEDDDGNAAASRAPAQERTQERAQERAPARERPPAREPEPGKRLHERVPETPAGPMPLSKAEALEIKGKRLGDMSDERLHQLHDWAVEKGNTVYQAAAQTLLAAREAAMLADEADALDLGVPERPGTSNDSLPF